MNGALPTRVARRPARRSTAEALIRSLLEKAGVAIGGTAPHDIIVHDPRVYGRVLRGGSLALGEAYIDGWWDSAAVDQTLSRVLQANLAQRAGVPLIETAAALAAKVMNLQSRRRATAVARQHYDVGNDLYRAMLDRRLVYTCGYWQTANSLDEAQEAKLELVCRKLALRPGMTLLDLGCGFGGLARYAAEKYQVHVTGLTLSQRQCELGQQLCAGLPVELRVQDYREARGGFDRIVSIGLLEHVGPRNYRTYMRVVDRCLKPGGISLCHTIINPLSQTVGDPWLTRYIFPNSSLPSIAQLARAMEGVFLFDDLHAFGGDYDRTLIAWYRNFVRAWPELAPRYGERFYRMWTYYLLMCAAIFRSRTALLCQVVMSRADTPSPERVRL